MNSRSIFGRQWKCLRHEFLGGLEQLREIYIEMAERLIAGDAISLFQIGVHLGTCSDINTVALGLNHHNHNI